jgi:hypothetical protein
MNVLAFKLNKERKLHFKIQDHTNDKILRRSKT